jgi:hypothetical protein
MYRKYINIVEAANKGCPIATHDLEVNVKNRQTAIDNHHYGPANPDEPGNYWKESAKQWGIDEKTAKTMPLTSQMLCTSVWKKAWARKPTMLKRPVKPQT